MIRRSLRDAEELTNKARIRRALSYAYLAVVATSVLGADYATRANSAEHPDDVVEVGYLLVAMLALSLVHVRIERGRLTLSALVIGAAAVLLNQIDATLVGLSLGLAVGRRDRWQIAVNAILPAAFVTLGAAVAGTFRSGGSIGLEARIAVLASTYIADWILVAFAISLHSGESVRSVVRHGFTGPFYLAFLYFGLAALLISYVLNGTALGYLLASIVCVLALALTDTISGRRMRRALESELSDADRHLFHSRAVEGVVHNLRNHLATAVGYLKEIDPHRLDPVDRDAVETATAAANDAVSVLRTLSQGATPRVSYATEPIDLNELVTRALGMGRARARSKEVELALRESSEDVKVKADPLLMREVITNLVNNAIDAAPTKGRVELSTGRRGNGWPFFSVSDNGAGVSEENRHRLFEPHFTTKEGGTGLGLFMSYGIVREHQGELLYEGSRRGAVFTVVLPPFGA